MTAAKIPSISGDTGLTYLAEGAANIVYRFEIRHPTPPPSQLEEYGEGTPPPTEIESDFDEKGDGFECAGVFENKLLRLRKGLSTTLPVSVTQEAWERVIAPLFLPTEIVQQSLVRLESRVIHDLNTKLQHWEQDPADAQNPRPSIRRGIYLADDEFGLLVTDMTAGSQGDTVIEFKPKWLIQSPSAPKNAVRCRQCARFARANAELARENESLKKVWCPLELSMNESRRLAQILFPPEERDEMFPRFQSWLSSNTLLPRLRQLQKALDPIGVLENDKNNDMFRAAMTLRDCSVFVRFPATVADDHLIEARIGDLDLKSPNKAQYWKDIENSLINGGWYTGTEKAEDRQPLTCQLSPKGEDAMRAFLLSQS